VRHAQMDFLAMHWMTTAKVSLVFTVVSAYEQLYDCMHFHP
jgi:hypothetical protein